MVGARTPGTPYSAVVLCSMSLVPSSVGMCRNIQISGTKSFQLVDAPHELRASVARSRSKSQFGICRMY